MAMLSVSVRVKSDGQDEEPWQNEIEVPDEIANLKHQHLLELIGFGLAFQAEFDGGDGDNHLTIQLDDETIFEDKE